MVVDIERLIQNEYFQVLLILASSIIAVAVVSRILGVLISRWRRVQKKFENMPKLLSSLVAIVIYTGIA